jgi:hypothetical protein
MRRAKDDLKGPPKPCLIASHPGLIFNAARLIPFSPSVLSVAGRTSLIFLIAVRHGIGSVGMRSSPPSLDAARVRCLC